jgi:predicted transcriptional regulator
MAITKQIFEAIFHIEFMNQNNPELLSKAMEIQEKEATKILLELEKQGIIKIQKKENKIYGSQLTEKGKEIFNNKKYLNWKLKLGY